ncbi:MAG TPA: GAF domain-containing protein [Thermoleophilaceae bacterium]|nr:GAF domain-containing protein [Thermoleophilaceae bacterium]
MRVKDAHHLSQDESTSGALRSVSTILERGVADMASVFDAFGVGIYCLDRDGRFGYVNPAAETLLGWRAEQLLGRSAHDLIHHSRPDGSPLPRDECSFFRAVRRGATRRELNDVFWRKDGSAMPVVYTLAPLHDDDEHVGAIVMFADESARRRDAELLRVRTSQQAALAELGLRALGGGELQDLFQHAGAVVARTLNAEFSQVLELIDEQQGLRLVAGVGWRAGTVGAAHVGLDQESQAGFAVASDQSVVVDDWRAETRFSAAPLLRAHGVVSGVSAVIHGRDHPWGGEPWGVVGAHSRLAREFSPEDVNFVESVANTLALAIERRETEEELWQRNAEMANLTGQLTRLADERRRILADALDAEDRTRERVSQLLHDEVLQSLLSARQDLGKARRHRGGDDDAVRQAGDAVVEAIGELRSAVVALHPVTRARGGIAAAIRAVADIHATRGGFEVALNLQPQASGFHDQLIVSLVRELLANVTQHAQASRVTIGLRRTREHIVFEVADNGCGMGPGRPEEALAQGHVGLASIAMRVESCGGRFELIGNRSEGTRARAVLPAARARGSSGSRRGSRD